MVEINNIRHVVDTIVHGEKLSTFSNNYKKQS